MKTPTDDPRPRTQPPVSTITANEIELTNLFWHCRIATMLRDELPPSTVRNAAFAKAVRMATYCHVGANGVQYASQDAIDAAGPATKRKWTGKGLTKEHVIPVAVIAGFVREALDKPSLAHDSFLSDLDTANYSRAVTAFFLKHPRAWQMARVVRDWTLMAWITVEENDRFNDKARHGGKTIRTCMPPGWTRNQCRFKRYTDCNIQLLPLS